MKIPSPHPDHPDSVRFIWWKDGLFGDEVEHEIRWPIGRTTRGLMWNNRRPDTYEIPKHEKERTDSLSRSFRLMWDYTLA
jgi:hypothetical protein